MLQMHMSVAQKPAHKRTKKMGILIPKVTAPQKAFEHRQLDAQDVKSNDKPPSQ